MPFNMKLCAKDKEEFRSFLLVLHFSDISSALKEKNPSGEKKIVNNLFAKIHTQRLEIKNALKILQFGDSK